MNFYEKIAIQEELENLELLNSMGVKANSKLKDREVLNSNDYVSDKIVHIPNFYISEPDYSNFSLENRNKEINNILEKNSVQNFEYNHWRINNKLEPIDFSEVIQFLTRFKNNM